MNINHNQLLENVGIAVFAFAPWALQALRALETFLGTSNGTLMGGNYSLGFFTAAVKYELAIEATTKNAGENCFH